MQPEQVGTKILPSICRDDVRLYADSATLFALGARVATCLEENFIHLLAAKYDFNTLFLYHATKKAANVTYYGFIAYPEVSVDLWATGETPTTRFQEG